MNNVNVGCVNLAYNNQNLSLSLSGSRSSNSPQSWCFVRMERCIKRSPTLQMPIKTLSLSCTDLHSRYKPCCPEICHTLQNCNKQGCDAQHTPCPGTGHKTMFMYSSGDGMVRGFSLRSNNYVKQRLSNDCECTETHRSGFLTCCSVDAAVCQRRGEDSSR